MSHTMDPTKMPAMYPPSGMIYDFNAPNPIRDVVDGASIFCISLCTILLMVQLLTKRHLLHGLKWEDCEAPGVLAWWVLVQCLTGSRCYCPRLGNHSLLQVEPSGEQYAERFCRPCSCHTVDSVCYHSTVMAPASINGTSQWLKWSALQM